MKCLLCPREIIFQSCNSQSNGGTEFVGGGVYGSTITDDEYKYAVYICDYCMQLKMTDTSRVSIFKEYPRTTYTRIPKDE